MAFSSGRALRIGGQPPMISLIASGGELFNFSHSGCQSGLTTLWSDSKPLGLDESDIGDADEIENAPEVAFLMVKKGGRKVAAVEASAR